MNNGIKVVIIDYGTGNLFSVAQACQKVGLDCCITSDPDDFKKADGIILPGVGAFRKAMENLSERQLIEPIKKSISDGKHFMGICLGMQLIMSSSSEFGECEGLDIIEGKVEKFNFSKRKDINGKIPEVGWNKILQKELKWNSTPLQLLSDGEYMYFVHSYYAVPKEKGVVLSTTTYEGIEYCSSILKDNVFATQFHPEKSGKKGITIYAEWAKIIKGTKRNT